MVSERIRDEQAVVTKDVWDRRTKVIALNDDEEKMAQEREDTNYLSFYRLRTAMLLAKLRHTDRYRSKPWQLGKA